MTRWRLALRLARREALRARGRSVLVLVMIALPVLGVTAADVVIATSTISGTEALERRLGTADARVTFDMGSGRVEQSPDPDNGGSGYFGGARKAPPPTIASVRSALGRDVRALQVRNGSVHLTTRHGVADVQAVETDLRDPLADGTYTLASGRLPRSAGEALINSDLASRGFGLGDEIDLRSGRTLTVVGIGDNASYRGYPILVAPPGTLHLHGTGGQTTWLLDAGGPVTWSDVKKINAVGGLVLSRAVLADPPRQAELYPDMSGLDGGDDAIIAVIALIVVMALLEVVLLAGPAFAVGARRLSHSLALMAASGATPTQARRVVLATGLVLGGAGALLGLALGLLAAWLVLPIVQHFSHSFLGPYDVPWLHLVGIAGFGLVSALLAAVVPAFIASRQDVVAVLAGRRGDRPPSRKSPLVGLAFLAVGVAGAAYGATASSGELTIAGSAIVSVLGMILVVPVVLRTLAVLGRGLPLPLRFAVRDAVRHRTRTVPAVAAVAATVAGVVALGIANASDAAQNEASYQPELGLGQASLSAYGKQPDWHAYAAVARQYLPDATVTEVQGVSHEALVTLRAPDGRRIPLSSGSRFDTSFLVSDHVPSPATGLTVAQRAAASDVLGRGGVVVFGARPGPGVATVLATTRRLGGKHRDPYRSARAELPAAYVQVPGDYARFMGVLSTQAARALGVEPVTVGIVVDGATITTAQEQDVEEALSALSSKTSFYVERGYQNEDQVVILLLVLGALGAALMLGGTLTATFLALSDARPDLATLAAVGASPRSRRGVAASYAAVVGVVGAVLGAAVGFVPGVAISFPLTQRYQGTGPSHYLDVPWLLVLGLVVALPLLTTVVVGLCTRSRLPLVARLD
ncbi:MAG TPA: FtsX-like permease family protein [Nocardioides sp.]|nr:FtsX-like permease family protein [Nocardioides sp.]